MTGNKEAHLKIELMCYTCIDCEDKNCESPTCVKEPTEMQLQTDVEGSGEARYKCPRCSAIVTLRAHLDN